MSSDGGRTGRGGPLDLVWCHSRPACRASGLRSPPAPTNPPASLGRPGLVQRVQSRPGPRKSEREKREGVYTFATERERERDHRQRTQARLHPLPGSSGLSQGPRRTQTRDPPTRAQDPYERAPPRPSKPGTPHDPTSTPSLRRML